MKSLLDEYGVIVFGFFSYTSISRFEYQTIRETAEKSGLFFTETGDGAIEPYVSVKLIDRSFNERFNKIADELYEFNNKNILESYKVYTVEDFIGKITKNTK
jgi:hypothetical protein